MREVIEIDKDFDLGTTKYSSKEKPLSKVKGKVTVSLFEDSNKVRDIFTENKVMEWFKEDAYYRHYESLLGKNTVNAGYIDKPTKYIILSNKNKEEVDVDCISTTKDVIGYAERQVTYSGSDTQKGSYNINESRVYTDVDGNLVCHEVYDFPTHACNGEINSIMWSSSIKNEANITIATGKNTSFTHYPSQLTSAYYDKIKNEITYIGAGSHTEIISWNLDNNENTYITKLKHPLGSEFPQSPSYVYNLSINFLSKDIAVGSFFNNNYSTTGGVQPNKILSVKWDVNTGEVLEHEVIDLTNLKPIFKDENNTTFSSYLKAYIYENHIYMYGNNSSTGTKSLAKYDMNFNLIKQFHMGANSNSLNSTISNVYFVNNKIIAKNSNEIYIFDAQMNLIDYIKGTFDGVKIQNLNNAVIDRYNSGSIYYANLKLEVNPFTTYLKLPSTVIKTNTQTMKVQYDFVFEKNQAFNILLGVM